MSHRCWQRGLRALPLTLPSLLRSNAALRAEILALTPSPRTLNAMTVLSGVHPLLCARAASLEDMLHDAQTMLLSRGLVVHGEEIVFVAGVPPGISRSTNVMKLHRIGEATKLH